MRRKPDLLTQLAPDGQGLFTTTSRFFTKQLLPHHYKTRGGQTRQATGYPLLVSGHYPETLLAMLHPKESVDPILYQAMVMAEDTTIRRNRLNLLTIIDDLALQVGDPSKLQE